CRPRSCRWRRARRARRRAGREGASGTDGSFEHLSEREFCRARRARGPVERCQRRDVLELVVAEERPALKEPELAVLEPELDVPRLRLPARVRDRRELLGDLLTR